MSGWLKEYFSDFSKVCATQAKELLLLKETVYAPEWQEYYGFLIKT
jgi:hypothetical protein